MEVRPHQLRLHVVEPRLAYGIFAQNPATLGQGAGSRYLYREVGIGSGGGAIVDELEEYALVVREVRCFPYVLWPVPQVPRVLVLEVLLPLVARQPTLNQLQRYPRSIASLTISDSSFH